VPFASAEPDGPGPGCGVAEEAVPGVPLPAVVPPADEDAGGIVPESVGEPDVDAGVVPPVGDTAGDEDVADDEADGEADADGAADAVPDGLVCGDRDTPAGAAEGDPEQDADERVGDDFGGGNVEVSLGVGEAARRAMSAVPVTAKPPVPFALPPAVHFP
jgi:hypothetical protein